MTFLLSTQVPSLALPSKCSTELDPCDLAKPRGPPPIIHPTHQKDRLFIYFQASHWCPGLGKAVKRKKFFTPPQAHPPRGVASVPGLPDWYGPFGPPQHQKHCTTTHSHQPCGTSFEALPAPTVFGNHCGSKSPNNQHPESHFWCRFESPSIG